MSNTLLNQKTLKQKDCKVNKVLTFDSTKLTWNLWFNYKSNQRPWFNQQTNQKQNRSKKQIKQKKHENSKILEQNGSNPKKIKKHEEHSS